jgi:hypothetical protein
VKCRHNGTSAAEKLFHLVDGNTFQWNTGLFSKMKQGIQLAFTTDVPPPPPPVLFLTAAAVDLQRRHHIQERGKTICQDPIER